MDVNCPGSQEHLVSIYEPAHNLVEDVVSGVVIAPHLPALAVPHLPFCLQRWGGACTQSASFPLVFCSILCSVSGSCCKLEPFAGKFSILFFLLWRSHSVGSLSHINSLRLSSGHSGSALLQRTDDAAGTSLSSPHLLVADESVWATSPWQLWLGTYSVGSFFFFFLSSQMLPSEIPKLPTDPPVRGFLTVWKLLLLHAEKEMATHSSVLAWRIPGTGEAGGLPSLGSHRVRHN